ncbi:MAG: calcium/sodium antiporter [Candidatus Sabulitectum sp.]|nr:calcium/sodium antiporter [Candidatus Sabulitectum sp.]
MIQSYVLLTVGFVLLVLGGDNLIKGGSRLSALLGVSPLLIGLGIAAFGTSAPEAAVSIKAALGGHSAVSIGNILGSNIANIGLAIGISLLLFGIQGNHRKIWKEIVFGLLATLLLLFLCTAAFSREGSYGLNKIGGLVLLFFFAGYLVHLFRMSRSDKKKKQDEKPDHVKNRPLEYAKSIAMTLAGIAGVIFGGSFVVDNAVLIAASWGISQTLISVTIVALGTSLPEIVVSVIAVRKNHWDMALGNILGSNLFNILFVLGTTAVIKPMEFADYNQLVLPDLLIALCITVILFFIIMYRGKAAAALKRSRVHGAILLLAYMAYIVFAILRP